MEYLYLSMFLHETGKRIDEVNIKKIFDVFNIEADNDKVRFFIAALSILTNESIKKVEEVQNTSTVNQLANLQKSFETIKNSIAISDDRIENVKTESVEPFKYEFIKEDKTIHEKSARYVYAIADKGIRENLGAIGIEGAEVYTIPCREMCIIVHDCEPEPYKSQDDEVVKNWLFTQQEVLDVVSDKFGVVLPMSFDMIIQGKNGNDSEEEVKAWVEERYDDFYEKINFLRNKQEYGVQVIIDTNDLSKILINTDEKLQLKQKEIEDKPKGLAYMEKEVLKDMIKEKFEEIADDYFREFYNIIKQCTDDIVIEKTKKVEANKQMIMNLSCLVHKDRVNELGKELEKIEEKVGVSVRFSGPWAPFSFVTPEKGGVK